MKRYYLPLLLLLCGFTRIHSEYDTPQKTQDEFINVETNLEDQQFTVLNDTPALSAIKDGQIVIVSSNSYQRLMYRNGQDIYAITGSCVTVRR